MESKLQTFKFEFQGATGVSEAASYFAPAEEGVVENEERKGRDMIEIVDALGIVLRHVFHLFSFGWNATVLKIWQLNDGVSRG